MKPMKVDINTELSDLIRKRVKFLFNKNPTLFEQLGIISAATIDKEELEELYADVFDFVTRVGAKCFKAGFGSGANAILDNIRLGDKVEEVKPEDIVVGRDVAIKHLEFV